jgi:hypothetical protein
MVKKIRCSVTIFGRQKYFFLCSYFTISGDQLNICLNNVVIDVADSVKFLGVRIDAGLKWKEELDAVEHSISSACYALRSLREELTIEQLKVIYYALVESKLRYSIRLWGNSFKYNLNKALVIQKRAIRTIVRIPQWISCREHFLELGILTVPCLYVLVLLTDLVKNILKYESIEEQDLRIQTRNKNLTPSFFPKLKVAQHSTKHQAVKIFNKLPPDLKNITNYKTFHKKLKAFLLRGCFYSIDEIFVRDT